VLRTAGGAGALRPLPRRALARHRSCLPLGPGRVHTVGRAQRHRGSGWRGAALVAPLPRVARHSGLARSSIARKAAAVRGYFAWCRRAGLLAEDPSRGLSAPSAGGRLPTLLSHAEIDTLLDGEPSPGGTRSVLDAAIVLRDDAVLELLYAAGLRVAELCGIDRADLDLDAATVTCSQGQQGAPCPHPRPRRRCSRRWLSAGRSMLAGPSTPSGRSS